MKVSLAGIADNSPEAASKVLKNFFWAVTFMRAHKTLVQHEVSLDQDSLAYLVAAKAWIDLATVDPTELDKRALHGREEIVELLEHLVPDPEDRQITVEKVASTLGIIIAEQSMESVTADDREVAQKFLGDASMPPY